MSSFNLLERMVTAEGQAVRLGASASRWCALGSIPKPKVVSSHV